jgi:uncharacterized protein YjbJ (UPF0337 family)
VLSAIFDQAKGRLKEAIGSLTGNEGLKSEGRDDQRSANTKRAVGNASEKAKDAVDDVADKATVVVDKTKDVLHQK